MKNRLYLLIAITISMALQACTLVSTNELSNTESVALTGKTLTYTQYRELPSFPAQTALNVQFGLMGLASAISSGDAMIQRNQVIDPALKISEELAAGLKDNQNMQLVINDQIYTDSSDIDDLVQIYSGHDYILDVKTLGWGSIYFASDWNNYKVMYTAHARLIDSKTSTVVAEEICSHQPDYEDTDLAPSYEDLESGYGLKKELAKSVSYCVDHIRNMTKLHTKGSAVTLTADNTANEPKI